MGGRSVSMWWKVNWWFLGMLALLFAVIAGYCPQPTEATITVTQLTSTTSGAVFLSNHSINADGTRIAFLSTANPTGGNPDGNDEIFLWTQGSGISQLTHTTGGGATYLWSRALNADGTRIAFTSDRNLTGGNPDGNDEIFLWTQGGGIAQITNTTGGGITRLSISADGTRIAFQSRNNLTGGNPDGMWQIFLWAQGSGITHVSHTWGDHHDPSINADGTRIAFYAYGNPTGGNPDGNDEIFLWTQGGGIAQITNSTWADSLYPSISGDGTRVVFRSNGDWTGSNPDHHDQLFLWTQGRGITQLTNMGSVSYYGNLSFSADGIRIAIALAGNLTDGNPEGNAELFLATIGGTPLPPSGFSFGHPTMAPKNQRCDYGSKTCAAKGRYHTGVDYSGNGTAVAVDRGTVVRIENMSRLDHGMGNNVIVSHTLRDGSPTFSTYSHLASIDPGIAENRPVDKGQILGVIGCSGFGDQYYWCRRGKIRNYHSPHLHFEMKTVNGRVSDIPSTVTGNPKGVGKQNSTCERDPKNAAPNTCWGYVGNTLVPDQYGYVNPNRYLPR